MSLTVPLTLYFQFLALVTLSISVPLRLSTLYHLLPLTHLFLGWQYFLKALKFLCTKLDTFPLL